MRKIDPKTNWEGFHWSFFINIQGLIISMTRFEQFVSVGDIQLARTELKTITSLMLAAAASMELAGSFSRKEYDEIVRPSMMPPNVESDGLSGLQMREHTYLMKVWKRNQHIFHNMPASLKSEHDDFVSAYLALSKSHKKVCSKFGGDEKSSLRTSKTTAIKTIEKYETNRRKIITKT